MISDESDRFNPRDPKPADAGKPSKSVKRREARQLATQALYQWHMAKQSLNEIEAQFRVDNDFSDVDGAYFREILHGVPAYKTEIDTALKPCLDLTIEELDPVELAVSAPVHLGTAQARRRAVPRCDQRRYRTGESLRFHRRPQVRQRCARQAGPASA